jgi:hypothetical protein
MTRVTEWVFGIVGGIAAFLGLFIMFGGEGQSLGLGGDLTWEVGEIAAEWGYGLLAGGLVLLLITLAMAVRDRRRPKVYRPKSEFAGLMWHMGIFVVVNAFLWTQDIVQGGGLEYAYWATIPWGAGLVIHTLTYIFAGRRADEGMVDRVVEEKESRELQHH